MKRTLLIGLAIGVMVTLLASLLLLPPGRGHNSTEASGGSGDPPTIFGIDLDPSGNSCVPPDEETSTGGYCTLGTIDKCIQVESTDSGPAIPGPLFDIDVFMDDVPGAEHPNGAKDLAGADFFMHYDKNYLQVNGWGGAGNGCRDWLLGTKLGSVACLEAGQTVFPDVDGALGVSLADTGGAAGAELPGARGPLERYTVQVVQAGPKIVPITFAAGGLNNTYFASSVMGRYGADHVSDANYSPQYGLIAIDTPCAPVTVTPTSTATLTPTATLTATATATLTPTPAPTSVDLVTGWNHVCYVGPSQATQDALADIGDAVLAVYRLRPDQGYDKWFPGRPDISTMTSVGSYESLLLLMSSNRSWSQNAAASPPASRDLTQGWDSVCYLGQTKEVEAATASIAGKFSIIYALAPEQSWKRFVPARPEIGNLASLQRFSSVLILLTQAEGAQWVFDP